MNANIDPASFEWFFEKAVQQPSSVPCPYPDWDNPENWEQFTGNSREIPDGEVVLVFKEEAVAPYAFRKYVASGDWFERQSSGHIRAAAVREVYRYTGAANHETDICCPSLEGIL